MKVRKRSPGRPPKLADPVRMDVIVERDQRDALDLLAEARQASKNDLIREALDAYLSGNPTREGVTR